MRYTSTRPTPLLDNPDFHHSFGGEDGNSIPLTNALLKTVETVVFPNEPFEIVGAIPNSSIVQVTTPSYPYEGKFYTDLRFLAKRDPSSAEKKILLPPSEHILDELNKLIGTRYIWGGTWPEGIPDLLNWYPPKHPIETLGPLLQDTWILKGVDCSGLLYKVTNGCTPRNTSSLLHFGNPVLIEGLSISEIQKHLRPLDLIVWNGHVICVQDSHHTIESLGGKGVIRSDLETRLSTICMTRRPENQGAMGGDSFVIRRFIDSGFFNK